MKILNFGSLNFDYVYRVDNIVSPGETVSATEVHQYCGGKGLNQSIALARAGAEVYHAGLVGPDGGEFITLCGMNDIDTKYIRTIEERTGHTIIQVDHKGQNSIVVYGGANQRVDKAFVDEVLSGFGRGDIILLQNEISCLDFIIDRACEKEMGIILNPSPFNDRIRNCHLEKVSMFIINEVEGFDMTGERDPDEILDSMGVKFPEAEIVLTIGESGSIYYCNEKKMRQKAYRVNAVDTTAAGDTFTGYFVAEMAHGRELKDTLDIAAKAAAIAVTRNGAVPSIPTFDEVVDFKS